MQYSYSRFDNLDRRNGNGSSEYNDDWLDGMSIFDNEWGSSAATTFNPTGRDAFDDRLPKHKRDKFEKLYKIHNGKGEESRKTDIRQSHIENDAKTFMSVLEMPQPQRERVLLILENLDLSSNNFGGGRRYEKIILALCSLVSDESLSQKQYASIDNRLFLTDEFRELMDTTKMSSSELRKIREAIRQRSDEF